MKVLFAPDSFKGSLSAPDAAEAMAQGVRRVFPNADCILLPIADGGEGTRTALVTATGGQHIPCTVTGPLANKVNTAWGLLGDGETAVVELADAAGLTLLKDSQRDPKHTTTYGVGELLLAAANYPNIKRVVVGLGGSGTNDGGAGLLSALGVRFINANGDPLPPGGAALAHLAALDTTALRLNPSRIPLLIACDVDNPLTGPRGASAVFGPQKGASPADVALLDLALTQFGAVLGRGISAIPGAGAAGGTAAGLLWLFPQAALHPGIDLVLDTIGFDTYLRGADLVLTGEGKFDIQTLGGKAVAGVAKRAKSAGVPVGVLAGSVGADMRRDALTKLGIGVVSAIVPGPVSLAEAMQNAAGYLADAAEQAALWMKIGGRITPSP